MVESRATKVGANTARKFLFTRKLIFEAFLANYSEHSLKNRSSFFVKLLIKNCWQI